MPFSRSRRSEGNEYSKMSRLCNDWLQYGECNKKDACNLPHSLRDAGVVSLSCNSSSAASKTLVCYNWLVGNECSASCNFAHSFRELRHRQVPRIPERKTDVKTLCSEWLISGNCSNKDACFNAHGTDDAFTEPVSTASVCSFWYYGICRNDRSCNFKHTFITSRDFSNRKPGQQEKTNKVQMKNIYQEDINTLILTQLPIVTNIIKIMSRNDFFKDVETMCQNLDATQLIMEKKHDLCIQAGKILEILLKKMITKLNIKTGDQTVSGMISILENKISNGSHFRYHADVIRFHRNIVSHSEVTERAEIKIKDVYDVLNSLFSVMNIISSC